MVLGKHEYLDPPFFWVYFRLDPPYSILSSIIRMSLWTSYPYFLSHSHSYWRHWCLVGSSSIHKLLGSKTIFYLAFHTSLGLHFDVQDQKQCYLVWLLGPFAFVDFKSPFDSYCHANLKFPWFFYKLFDISPYSLYRLDLHLLFFQKIQKFNSSKKKISYSNLLKST